MTTPDPSARTPYNTPLPGTPPIPPAALPPNQPPRPTPPGQATTQPPDATASSSKPATLTLVALAVAGLSLILGLIGVGVGVSAQARNTQLQAQVDELEAQQAAVDGTLADLDQRTGTSLAEYLQDLDTRLGDAEAAARGAFTRADEAASSARFAEDYAFGVDSRLSAVVDCVNKYMKTVGDSGGGYYQYFFCR